jgi:hypothetical protein
LNMAFLPKQPLRILSGLSWAVMLCSPTQGISSSRFWNYYLATEWLDPTMQASAGHRRESNALSRWIPLDYDEFSKSISMAMICSTWLDTWKALNGNKPRQNIPWNQDRLWPSLGSFPCRRPRTWLTLQHDSGASVTTKPKHPRVC